MPQSTPTTPNEEPADEPSLYRYQLRRMIAWYLEALDPLQEETFTWQPPSPQANTLAAICTHAISSAEWWVLSCVGNRSLERDRDAEFAAETSWAELRPRFTRFLEQADNLLAGMDSTQFGAISRNPAGNRTNRRCLVHTVEHLGIHLGHVEITSDWWRAENEGDE